VNKTYLYTQAWKYSSIDLNSEAKEEGERKGHRVTCAGMVGPSRASTSSKVFWSNQHSFLYQQPINIIMAANKVVILTGASRGKEERKHVREDGD